MTVTKQQIRVLVKNELSKPEILTLIATLLPPADAPAKAPKEYVARHARPIDQPKPKAKGYTPKPKHTLVCVDCGTKVQTARVNQKRCSDCSKANTAKFLAARTVARVDAQLFAAGIGEHPEIIPIRARAVDFAVKGMDPVDSVQAAWAEVMGSPLS